jgi:hypothetical protein
MHQHLDEAGVDKGDLSFRVQAASTWIKYLVRQLEAVTYELRETRKALKGYEDKENER